MLRSLIVLVGCYLSIGTMLYFMQKKIFFPVANISSARNEVMKPPDGIKEFRTLTTDGESITVWRSAPESQRTPKRVAIIFHGNGETVANKNFIPFFNRHGVIAYTFDYRGYGTSTGTPSTEGIYLDAKAVWDLVKREENIDPKELIILGNSIGSGPASYLAAQLDVGVFILIAGYSSLKSIVESTSFERYFTPFLYFEFPTFQFVKKLTRACVILGHGMKDNIIPFTELEKIYSALPKNLSISKLISEKASHNDIYFAIESELNNVLDKCLAL